MRRHYLKLTIHQLGFVVHSTMLSTSCTALWRIPCGATVEASLLERPLELGVSHTPRESPHASGAPGSQPVARWQQARKCSESKSWTDTAKRQDKSCLSRGKPRDFLRRVPDAPQFSEAHVTVGGGQSTHHTSRSNALAAHNTAVPWPFRTRHANPNRRMEKICLQIQIAYMPWTPGCFWTKQIRQQQQQRQQKQQRPVQICIVACPHSLPQLPLPEATHHSLSAKHSQTYRRTPNLSQTASTIVCMLQDPVAPPCTTHAMPQGGEGGGGGGFARVAST